MKQFKTITYFILLFSIFTSCVQEREFDAPKIDNTNPDITVNTTIAKVKALATDKPVKITENLVVEGYVISNDEAGNFYRTLHFQDAPTNPTHGLQLDVDLQDMYTTYQVGRKIYIKLKGLYIQNYKGTIKIGNVYKNKYGDFAIGRLSAETAKNVLFRSNEKPQKVEPKIVAIEDINNDMINTLIKLENVEVAAQSLCEEKTYSKETKNTNIVIQDCNGKTIILRNSGYSRFYKEKLPIGNGSIVAILGKYYKTFQLTIRDVSDVNMDKNRCNGSKDFSCETPEKNATIQKVKDLYKDARIQIADNLTFEGTITANDKEGNFYKMIYVEDETGGIKIKINSRKLYSKGYKIGQKIVVTTKGLYFDNENGEFTLGGGIYKGKIGGIEPLAEYNHLRLKEENKPLQPTVISQPKDSDVGKLVQFDKMQFVEMEQPFVVTGKSYGKREIINCDTQYIIPIETSKYASFAKEKTPAKNGSIVGILGKYKDTYRLLLRDKSDYAKMTETPCEIVQPATFKSVKEIRNLFTGDDTTIKDNFKIKVVVTSDKETKNISSQNAFAQDDSAGIVLHFDTAHNLNLGDEVEILLKDIPIVKSDDLLQLNISASAITNKVAGTLPTPKQITMSNALSGAYESRLIQIKNVQFKDTSKTYNGDNILTDCKKEITVFVDENAPFSTENVATKNGTITGIISNQQGTKLYVRDTNDINFTDDYKDCSDYNPPTSSEGIYFSEYGEGSSYNKYIEIYNGTGATVDLSNYTIKLYINGKTEVKSTLTFDAGTELADKGVYVIYNSKADDKIKSKGNKASTVTYFNGDDALELLKGDTVIDVFGVVGENPGKNKGWSVAGVKNATKDHTLIRKSSVTEGNTDWETSSGTDEDSSEWIVKEKNYWDNIGVR